MTRAAKPLVIAIFLILWLIVSIQRVPESIGKPPDIGIDTSWVVALPEMLHQHSISGRDFHFTYGPLSQLLAYAGAALHTPWSAIDSLPLIMLAFYGASVALVALILLLLPSVDWKSCVFIYAAIAALNLFSEPTAFRPLALMLCAILFARAMTNMALNKDKKPSLKILFGLPALAGVCCIAAQLLTFELGPYALASIAAGGFLIAVRKRKRARFWFCFGILSAVYIAANLGLDLAFYLSGSNYAFFDYQRYALETIRGFTYSQALPWELGATQTLGLLLVGVFTIGAAAVIALRSESKDAEIFALLLACAVIEFKSLTVRSDVGHITQSSSALLFVFLLCGAVFVSKWRRSKAGLMLWTVAFVTLWFSWPWAGTYFAADLWHAATGRSPFSKLAAIRSASSNTTASADSGRPLLAFPYENYIPLSMKRRLVAPVLMSYNASTEQLQRFYVEQLDREGDLQVVYGIDDVASKAIDGIQAISRVPLVFDYLYQHFRLSGEDPSLAKGFYLLRRDTSTSRHFDSTEVQASGPAACNILRLTLEMDYPVRRFAGRPTPIEVLFSKGGTPFLKTTLVALKPNEAFSTYVNLIPPDHFQEIFGSGPIAPTAWDKLEISPRASDWLGVAPRVDVRKIECLLAQ